MTYVIECSALFSSKSFIVSGLTLRSLIHFEFIFVYGVRKCSIFILLHVAVQFYQHRFFEDAVFVPLYILALVVKNKAPIGVWVYFWAFYLVPLYHNVLMIAHATQYQKNKQPNQKVRKRPKQTFHQRHTNG